MDAKAVNIVSPVKTRIIPVTHKVCACSTVKGVNYEVCREHTYSKTPTEHEQSLVENRLLAEVSKELAAKIESVLDKSAERASNKAYEFSYELNKKPAPTEKDFLDLYESEVIAWDANLTASENKQLAPSKREAYYKKAWEHRNNAFAAFEKAPEFGICDWFICQTIR